MNTPWSRAGQTALPGAPSERMAQPAGPAPQPPVDLAAQHAKVVGQAAGRPPSRAQPAEATPRPAGRTRLAPQKQDDGDSLSADDLEGIKNPNDE